MRTFKRKLTAPYQKALHRTLEQQSTAHECRKIQPWNNQQLQADRTEQSVEQQKSNVQTKRHVYIELNVHTGVSERRRERAHT